MEQLHVGAVMCVVQKSRSKHLCEHKVDQLQGGG